MKSSASDECFDVASYGAYAIFILSMMVEYFLGGISSVFRERQPDLGAYGIYRFAKIAEEAFREAARHHLVFHFR